MLYIHSQSNCEKWHNLAYIYTQPLCNYKSQIPNNRCYYYILLLGKLYCYLMAYFSLLLTVILTVASTGAAPIYCSDVQSPASGSHNTYDNYCIICNNHTNSFGLCHVLLLSPEIRNI